MLFYFFSLNTIRLTRKVHIKSKFISSFRVSKLSCLLSIFIGILLLLYRQRTEWKTQLSISPPNLNKAELKSSLTVLHDVTTQGSNSQLIRHLFVAATAHHMPSTEPLLRQQRELQSHAFPPFHFPRFPPFPQWRHARHVSWQVTAAAGRHFESCRTVTTLFPIRKKRFWCTTTGWSGASIARPSSKSIFRLPFC